MTGRRRRGLNFIFVGPTPAIKNFDCFFSGVRRKFRWNWTKWFCKLDRLSKKTLWDGLDKTVHASPDRSRNRASSLFFLGSWVDLEDSSDPKNATFDLGWPTPSSASSSLSSSSSSSPSRTGHPPIWDHFLILRLIRRWREVLPSDELFTVLRRIVRPPQVFLAAWLFVQTAFCRKDSWLEWKLGYRDNLDDTICLKLDSVKHS